MSNQASGTPIQVLVCPGNPGCPTANTPAPSNTVTNGPVPPSGASSDISARGGKTAGPVTPENPRSDEVPPQGIDMSKLKAPDTVYATMMLRGRGRSSSCVASCFRCSQYVSVSMAYHLTRFLSLDSHVLAHRVQHVTRTSVWWGLFVVCMSYLSSTGATASCAVS